MSLDQAVSLRPGQTRVYIETNASLPGFGERRLTVQERVTSLVEQPAGARAYVIERKPLKAESQHPVTKKWQKDKLSPTEPESQGSRHGLLVDGQRLAEWFESAPRQDYIAEFPAEDGATFSVPNRGGKLATYKWSHVESIKVDAGTFQNCFAATTETQKGGSLRRTWCTGVGMVELILTNSGGGTVRRALASFRDAKPGR